MSLPDSRALAHRLLLYGIITHHLDSTRMTIKRRTCSRYQLVALTTGAALLLLLAACGGDTAPETADLAATAASDSSANSDQHDDDSTPVPDTTATTTTRLTIAFAANFDSAKPCQKLDGDGCDLYVASLSPTTFEVESVLRLTSTATSRESFPSIDRSGRVILFERSEGNKNSIAFVSIDGKQSDALIPGRYPDFAHGDDRFVFSTDDHQLTVAHYRVDGDRLAISDTEIVGTGRDPQFFPDGSQLLFHYQPDGEETRAALLSLSDNSVTDFSEPNSCAHTSVSPDGSIGTCGRLGKSWFRQWSGSEWTPMGLLTEPLAPSAYGARFAGCGMVSYGFIEFCGDNDTVILNVICSNGGERVFNTLFLVRLSSGELVDLHSRLQQKYGVADKESYTASCH